MVVMPHTLNFYSAGLQGLINNRLPTANCFKSASDDFFFIDTKRDQRLSSCHLVGFRSEEEQQRLG